MKKLLLIMLMSVGVLTAQAQTEQPHWYGYPKDRQIAAATGLLTAGIFYPIARAAQPEEPKWKAMVVSLGTATLAGATIAAMPNQSAVERRQNFTAAFISGLTITLTFSLGI